MKARTSTLWLGLLCLIPSSSLAANRYLMAALGDSITAAFLANTSLADPDATDLSSIHFGFADLLTNRSTLSWSTGTDIPSHFNRLKMLLEGTDGTDELKSYNIAVPGDTSEQMFIQAEKLLAKKEIEGYDSVKYVTVMFGANDACTPHFPGGIPLSQMKANLKRGFNELARISQSEPLRVLVGGIPRIPDLGKPAIVSRRTIGDMTCAQFRADIINSCGAMVDWKTDAEYHKDLQSIEARNSVIQEAAEEAGKEHPNLQVVYSNEMYDSPISYNLLAVDCFHPNTTGQALIADKLWAAQPWY